MILWLLACAPDLAPGELLVCGTAPNCVSSVAADDVHRVAPLPPRPLAEVVRAIEAVPGCVVRHQQASWVAAACTTPSGLFTDDLVVRVADGGVQVSSKSRVGYSDLGVNRDRVDRLREHMASGDPPAAGGH